MNDERQPQCAVPAEESLQAAVMIDMSVRDGDGAQVGHVDLHDIQVVLERQRRKATVVEDRLTIAVHRHGYQR